MNRRQLLSGTTAILATLCERPSGALAREPVNALAAVRAQLRAKGGLTSAEKAFVVDTAKLIIEEIFVHRAMKTALYGVDVMPQLRALRLRVSKMDDDQFHREMRRIFAQLRDAHTSYVWYEEGGVSSLGIRIGKVAAGDAPRYYVTRSNIEETLPVGSEVTHWNGTPLGATIDELSEEIGAGNVASRRARALTYLTRRVLSRSELPKEEWVVLS